MSRATVRERLLHAWRALRYRLRPPRRLKLRRSGGFLIFGTFALGLATLNTGNNLLYLLLGALLGTIALSGWLSEQALRSVTVRRTVPRALSAGVHGRIEYELRNRDTRRDSIGIAVTEVLDTAGVRLKVADGVRLGTGFLNVIGAGATARVRVDALPLRRGVYALEGVTVSTAFPFGLFSKERDVPLPGTVVVWPRTDLVLRAPLAGGRRGRRQHMRASAAATALRGDYRGLRQYRPGDDPRDIHWRTTARRGEPILREYDRDVSDEYWIVLDTAAPDEERGEAAVEIAATLAADAWKRGDRVGLVAGSARVEPGAGGGGLDIVLDLLAAVVLTRTGQLPALPVPRESCVLVTGRAAPGSGWGDTWVATHAEPA